MLTNNAPSVVVKANPAASRLDNAPLPLPNSFASGGSLAVDMRFGWRPANPYSGAPIPLYYDFAHYDDDIDYYTKDIHKVPVYLGPRIPNSL